MRVALPWLGYACGDCEYCNCGRETLCLSQQNTGYSINGGFAEYAVGYARHVVRVPDGVDPADAAPLTCAGVTTYKAVKVSGASSSDLVAVFGAGGLGHLAVQYARITGAAVVAVDVNEERLEPRARARRRARRPRRRGGPGRGDPAPRRRRRPRSPPRSRPTPFEQAFRSLRRGGTLVCVGLPAENEMRDPDLRDRARRAHDQGLDRRHAPRPRGGLRAAPPRADQGRVRDDAGRGQRGDRAGARRQRREPAARLPPPGIPCRRPTAGSPPPRRSERDTRCAGKPRRVCGFPQMRGCHRGPSLRVPRPETNS